LPKTLAEIAIEAGLVSKADAARAARLIDTKAQPLISILVREIGVDEVALVAAIRRQTRVPLIDPVDALPDVEAIRLLPRDACKRLRVLRERRVFRPALNDFLLVSCMTDLRCARAQTLTRLGNSTTIPCGAAASVVNCWIQRR